VAGVVVEGRFPRPRVLRAVITNILRYLFGGAARSWFRNIGSSAPALSSMTLLLLLSGVVGLTGFALHNLEQVEARQASLLHIYLRGDATATQVDSLWNRLAADPRVAGVSYVSTADALARAQSIPGLPQLAAASDSNPFPASLDVSVKSIGDIATIVSIATQRYERFSLVR